VTNKITPFLWFDNNLEEALQFYSSIFEDVKIANVGRVGDGSDAAILTAQFSINGQDFLAMNAGPQFKFTEAISFMIDCKDQAEVDYYWEKLTDGGEESMCGWLKDRFGLSWQVTPRQLMELVGSSDREGAARAMQAMMSMRKIDIAALQAAHDGAAV